MSRTGSRTPAELRAAVRARDGDECSVCGQLIDFTRPAGTFMGPSLEHVIPVAAGGARSDPANLRLAHARPCNAAKGAVHDGTDYAAIRDPTRMAALLAEGRHSRQVAAAIAKAMAASRSPRGISPEQRGPSRTEADAAAGRRIRTRHEEPRARPRNRESAAARDLRRVKSGARQARGPWSGLVVVEERSPWGAPVVTNNAARLTPADRDAARGRAILARHEAPEREPAAMLAAG
jgi:hypothetical protein